MTADSASASVRGRVPAHEVEVQAVVEAVDLADSGRIRSWVDAALQGLERPVEVVVRIVDEAEIQDLNKRFRHRDQPTNVLSFPSGHTSGHRGPGGELAGDSLDGWQEPALLGDLVICAPVVRREAGEQGKTREAHFAHMVVHGVLHLLGHDHLGDDQAAEMEAAECHILQALGYGDPYRQHSDSDDRASDG